MQDLRIGGQVPLTVGLGADEQGGAAAGLQRHLGGFFAEPAAGLDVAADAQPAALAGRRRGRLARRQTAEAGAPAGFSQDAREVAGVVGAAETGVVGKVLRPDEVPLPDLARREAGDAPGLLYQTLQQIGRFRPSGAAVGIDRDGVGEDALHVGEDGRDPVERRQHRRGGPGRDQRGEIGKIGPHVGPGLDPQTQETAAAVHRHCGLGHMVAALRIGEEAFGPLGSPLHRAAQLQGGEDRHHHFRIEEDLHAEAAADIRADQAELAGVQPHDLGQLPLQAKDPLIAAGQGDDAGLRIELGQGGARLQRVYHHAVVDDPDPGDLVRPGEGGGDRRFVALDPIEAEVIVQLLMQQRRPGRQRRPALRDRGQIFVSSFDQFGGIARLGQAPGHHEGQRIADKADLVFGQPAVARHRGAAAAAARHRRRAGNGADAGGGKIGAAVDGQDTRRGLSGLQVEGQDLGVRNGAAHHQAIALAGAGDVVGIAADAGDQAPILQPPHGLTYAELSHGRFPLLQSPRSNRLPLAGCRLPSSFPGPENR